MYIYLYRLHRNWNSEHKSLSISFSYLLTWSVCLSVGEFRTELIPNCWFCATSFYHILFYSFLIYPFKNWTNFFWKRDWSWIHRRYGWDILARHCSSHRNSLSLSHIFISIPTKWFLVLISIFFNKYIFNKSPWYLMDSVKGNLKINLFLLICNGILFFFF